MGQILARLGLTLSSFIILGAFGSWIIAVWTEDVKWGRTGMIALIVGVIGLVASAMFIDFNSEGNK